MRVRPTSSARFHKAQVAIAALVPALIVVLSVTGFVWAQKDITVVVDGRTLRMKTQASSVAALLEEAGIVVDAADLVTPALDAALEGKSTVLVRHSIPIVMDLGGSEVEIDVVGETVADALVAVGADPSSNPAVTPPLDTPLESGMTVAAPDAFTRVASEETAVPAPVRYEKDPSLRKGAKRVITTGRAGRALHVYRVLVTGGTEGEPVLTATRTVTPAVPRVVAVGTASRGGADVIASRPEPGKPPATGRRMRVEATGYSPRQPDLDYTTATGARARHGVIAVDPDVIPLGTRVYVPGYGHAVAADTGGAIDGRRIDLCFETVGEALRWGRRTVTVIVLD